MSNRLGGKQGTAYTGTNANQPPNMNYNDRAPNQYDTGYSVGDFWMDSSASENDRLWVLTSLNGNSTSRGQLAQWVQLGTGVPSNVETLSGNSGGAVGPDGSNNINVVGDGSTIVDVGNPGTNTITISTSGAVATQYDADSGTATPILGVLNVVGAGDVATSAAGNTITITGTGGSGLLSTLTGDSGGPISPSAGNIDILGGTDFIVVGNAGAHSLTIESAGFLANSFETDSGTAVPIAGIIEINAGNSSLVSGSSVAITAPGSTNVIQLSVTDANENTILGAASGNLSITGIENSGFGYTVFPALTDGDYNFAGGALSAASLTSGGFNSFVGAHSGLSLTTGNNNVLIGYSAGSSYTTNETANIVIGSDGTVGESSTIRIGTEGTQTKAFVAGVYGTTGLSSTQSVVVNSSGQLGTGPSSVPGGWTLIQSQSGPATTLDFVTGVTGYNLYAFVLHELTPGLNCSLGLNFSSNAGAQFFSNANSGYIYWYSLGNGSWIQGNGTTLFFAPLNEVISAVLFISTSAVNNTTVWGTGTGRSNTVRQYNFEGVTNIFGGFPALVNGYRWYSFAPTIPNGHIGSGTVSLYGII